MIKKDFSEIEIEEFYIKIGKKVKQARTGKGLTQLELTYALGLKSVSLVSAAELYRDKKHFNLEHIYKISKILDIEIKEFFN